MLSIARPSVFPPGGYRYVQPQTGMRFDGNAQFKAQCLLILAHRRGNRLPRATFVEVAEDVVMATCARVPGICIGHVTEDKFASLQPLGITPAPNQTRPVRRCGSCGGRKAKA